MKDRHEVYVHASGSSMGVSPEEGEELLRKGLVVRDGADFELTDGSSFDDVRVNLAES